MIKVDDKKSECSVALSYLLGSKVPIIVASGKGEIAKRINKIAEQNGIDIIEDAYLADILSERQIGECIPLEAYNAVASIFAFLIKRTQ